MKRVGAVAALLALALSPAAAAHSGGGARGYRSTLTAVEPPIQGLEARVPSGGCAGAALSQLPEG